MGGGCRGLEKHVTGGVVVEGWVQGDEVYAFRRQMVAQDSEVVAGEEVVGHA